VTRKKTTSEPNAKRWVHCAFGKIIKIKEHLWRETSQDWISFELLDCGSQWKFGVLCFVQHPFPLFLLDGEMCDIEKTPWIHRKIL
jgi:hypothetical protein